MSPNEHERHERYATRAARDLYALRRALVRETLGCLTNRDPAALRFETGRHGKPKLEGQAGPSFSVSCNEGLVALLVGPSAVGVDVEPRGPGIAVDLLARRYFASDEADALALLPVEERRAQFLRHWTLKEAYVKAIGEGMRMPLDQVRFRLGPELRVDGLSIGDQLQDGSPEWFFAQSVLADHWLCSWVVARGDGLGRSVR